MVEMIELEIITRGVYQDVGVDQDGIVYLVRKD